MTVVSWSIERFREITEIGGTLLAVLFAGIALFIDAIVRRAQTNSAITDRWQRIWAHYYDRPRLFGIFDKNRDVCAQPLTDEEIHFVNLLLNHLRDTRIAQSAGIFNQPEHLGEDIHGFLSYPAVRAAWERLKEFHDTKFVSFVERKRGTGSK